MYIQYINRYNYMLCVLQLLLVFIKMQDYKLCSAVKAGNVTEVENLIQSGAHIDSTEVSCIISLISNDVTK